MTTPLSFYVPLRLDGDIYRPMDDTGVDDEPEMQASLRMQTVGYERVTALVQLEGGIHRTQVAVSPEEPGVAYVEVDGDSIPLDVQAFQRSTASPQAYLDAVRAIARASEPPLPMTETPLDRWFVEPVFSDLDQEGRDEVFSWRRIKEFGRLVILGEPGAGKSSCLRRMALEATGHESALGGVTVPVYMQLRSCEAEDLTVEGLFRNARALAPSSELDPALFTPALSGHLLLLFDGLDEIEADEMRAEALQRISRVCERLPAARAVVTCRAAAYDSELSGFRRVAIKPFTTEQIAEWLLQHLTRLGSGRHWSEFWERLSKAPDIAAIVSNPMLLSVASTLFLREGALPSNPAHLIGRFVSMLLHEWDTARGVNRWPKAVVNPNQLAHGLSTISLALCQTERTLFTVDDVDHWRADYVGTQVPTPVFLAACSSTGLILPVQEGGWTFTHATIRDYLAARHLIDSTSDISEFFVSHLATSQRGRAWRYSCGLASDAGDLLDLVEHDQGLDQLQRAIMLADVLASDLTARKSAVEASCDFVAMVLETALAAFAGMAESDGEEWTMRLTAGPEDAPPADLRPKVVLLLMLLHQARSGAAKDLLVRRLEESNIRSVRSFASCLHLEGHFTVADQEDDGTYLLDAAVQPMAD
ncbi:NACHT domain-containing protein [Amycolatopsis sp. lyj-90]|uniref:NACHT domain-containing protein n=1 Tax=Amycolatopsis sp. lyj-90 TaxID=2789285 RepID=UPI003979DF24